MTDPTSITVIPAAPLHALEIWANPQAVATRVQKALGFALPVMGRSAANGAITLMRFEPNVWLAEGDVSVLADTLGDDGALTGIGGGVVRFRIAGPGWRELLLEGGVFDTSAAALPAGATAATVIDHVGVRLHVESDDACVVYVPSSYAQSLHHFWDAALPLLGA
ncbi:sarcosine oxidase subunit gamma family protein [Novosphingobium sp.]|uniref:sarcosine oxidase subunit gamma family protein n=1 Tax=Novosphingobium sp. TaxID=1874826 RepID=UPI0026114940|nr:sarcosine oxidase subunit gamma family protein [Novosphingobium sp.]